MSQLTDNLNLIVSIKSDIKSAIEAKGVSMTGVSFGSFADKIGEIQTGGQFVTEPLSVSANGTYNPGQGVDGFSQVVVDVPQSATGYTEKDITEGIQVVNLSNSASYVGSYAFYYRTTLSTVTLPNCQSVLSHAFQLCENITSVNLSICTSIDWYAFANCSRLSYISLPECRSINYYAFQGCNSLEELYLPSCSVISEAFQSCSSLRSVNLPVCSKIDGRCFFSCPNLSYVSIPECVSLGRSCFQTCKALSEINLPKCSSLDSQVFFNCTSFMKLTLGYSSVVSVKNVNAFSSTLIASGTGSIYVPSSLVDAYKSATIWSAFSSQIFPIPE